MTSDPSQSQQMRAGLWSLAAVCVLAMVGYRVINSLTADSQRQRLLQRRNPGVAATQAAGRHVEVVRDDPELMLSVLGQVGGVDSRDANGLTLVMKHSLLGHPKVVRMLMLQGAKVDVKDPEGQTALMMISDLPLDRFKETHLEVARVLLSCDASPSIKSSAGKSALDLAKARKNDSLLRAIRAARETS